MQIISLSHQRIYGHQHTFNAVVLFASSRNGNNHQNDKVDTSRAHPGTLPLGVVVDKRANHRFILLGLMTRLGSRRQAKPHMVREETYKAVFAALRTATINNAFKAPERPRLSASRVAIITREEEFRNSTLGELGG